MVPEIKWIIWLVSHGLTICSFWIDLFNSCYNLDLDIRLYKRNFINFHRNFKFKIFYYNEIFIKIELIKTIKVWTCWSIILLYKWKYYLTTQSIKFNCKHIFHLWLGMNFICTSLSKKKNYLYLVEFYVIVSFPPT